MFLHPQQPPSPPPLIMAQITATDHSSLPALNPTFAVPFIMPPSSSQAPPPLPNIYASNMDVAPFYDSGVCMMMDDGQGYCGNKLVGFGKTRKRGREDGEEDHSRTRSSTAPWIINKKIMISNANVQLAAANSSSKDERENRCCTMCSHPPPPPPASLAAAGDDHDHLSIGMLREQQELDIFILMQMERLKAEVEQRRRAYWHNLFQRLEQCMQMMLRHKDEEIAKMSRKNTALEEKVKVLLMEGQIWKTVAQTNEAAATALRRDLELAQASYREREGNNGEVADSASCCDGRSSHHSNLLNCHGCHKKEITVLVLPCRHLCLCTDCDATFDSCPLCMCAKSATIKVHMP
ncbi:hypothetical protein ACLOJK_011339 [Asimina triloba]